MTKKDKARLRAELDAMQAFSLKTLWKSADRWGEAAAGRGLGKDMPPHKRIGARRIAQRCYERFFDALEQAIKTQDFTWPTKSTTKKSASSPLSTARKKK